MKKFLIILVFAVVAMAAKAQPGVALTFASVDTLNGNETVYFTSGIFTGGEPVVIQAACDNVGGTSDGTLTLEGSIDGSDWVPLAEQSGILHGYATTGENDSLTITDGANITWIVEAGYFYKYRVKGAGTASDSTLVTTVYRRTPLE
jgi:hypothetical protein